MLLEDQSERSISCRNTCLKYELNGINLHRINKVHNLSDSTVTNPITYDSYTVKLDTSELINSNNDDRSDNVGFHQLYPTTTKSTGGYKIRASQNMPFEIATLKFRH